MTADRKAFAKLSQKDAAAAVARHETLYSGRIGGARAVFAFTDLSGLDLSGHNLADADFTGAILEDTNLSKCRLDSASFFGADLKRANLTQASLRRADLRGVSLKGANLTGADLFEADLREGTIAQKDRYGNLRVMQHDVGPTELPGATLHSANLERAKMNGTIAVQADFTDAMMKSCRLIRANLRQAKLAGANLENADLSGCNLAGANLAGAVLIGTKLDLAVLDGADLSNTLTTKMVGPDPGKMPVNPEAMLDAHARWAESSGREGTPADLSGMDLRRIPNLGTRQLTALIAPKAVLYGLDLEGASLQGSNLSGADLRCVRLCGADLRGVNLSGAMLTRSDLRDARLGPLVITDDRLLASRLERVEARYTDFRGADLRSVSFKQADLSYANLRDAHFRDNAFDGVTITGAKLPQSLAATLIKML